MQEPARSARDVASKGKDGDGAKSHTHVFIYPTPQELSEAESPTYQVDM